VFRKEKQNSFIFSNSAQAFLAFLNLKNHQNCYGKGTVQQIFLTFWKAEDMFFPMNFKM